MNGADVNFDVGRVIIRQRDVDDLQFAIAGLDVGRQRRHLQEGPAETAMSEQKKSERAALTALQLMLLTDPAYAELRERVQNSLADADARLAELHLEAEEMLAESAAKLDALEARAGELPDGTKVFRSVDGDVFTANGRALDAEERADVAWKPDAPSYEEYQAARDKHAQITEFNDAINRAQDRVDGGKATLESDHNDPTSAEDLEALESDITQSLDDLEIALQTMRGDAQSSPALVETFNQVSPELNIAAFSVSAPVQSVNSTPH